MKAPIEGDVITECLALIIVGSIAIVAMFTLGIEGKEIPLTIGGGLVGYMAKTVVSAIKRK